MRTVITGADGQLGYELATAFGDTEVVALTRDDLDITDHPAVLATIARLQPTVVLNAAAWTDVDGCEADPARAEAVNASGPASLAQACREVDARLVSYSTDYVFDGVAPEDARGWRRGFREDDEVAPLNAYGRSKALGEALVRETLPRHHLIRTAWLAGAGGRNFVTTMLELARKGGPIRVVDDQLGSPTFTVDLAAATRQLVETEHYGTIHLANSGVASWFELAGATFEMAGLTPDLRPIPSAELDRPAPRPSWSVLECALSTVWGVGPLPHWRDGLERLVAELSPVPA